MSNLLITLLIISFFGFFQTLVRIFLGGRSSSLDDRVPDSGLFLWEILVRSLTDYIVLIAVFAGALWII
jgi:hypothetical protein